MLKEQKRCSRVIGLILISLLTPISLIACNNGGKSNPQTKYMFISESSVQLDKFDTSTPYGSESNVLNTVDGICQQNADNLNSTWTAEVRTKAPNSKWKAMLIYGTERAATTSGVDSTGQTDWVLQPNVRYVELVTGSNMGVTNSWSVFGGGCSMDWKTTGKTRIESWNKLYHTKNVFSARSTLSRGAVDILTNNELAYTIADLQSYSMNNHNLTTASNTTAHLICVQQ